MALLSNLKTNIIAEQKSVASANEFKGKPICGANQYLILYILISSKKRNLLSKIICFCWKTEWIQSASAKFFLKRYSVLINLIVLHFISKRSYLLVHHWSL